MCEYKSNRQAGEGRNVMSDAVEVKGKRQNVAIDAEQYTHLKAYSTLTGVPVSVLVRRAMAEYIEVTIGAKLQTLAEKAHSDRAAHEASKAVAVVAPSPEYTPADAMSQAPTLEGTPVQLADDLPSWVTKSTDN